MSHIHAGVTCMVCGLQCLAEGLTSCSTEASRLGLSVARRERVSFIHCPRLRPLATPCSTRSSRFARPEASPTINLNGVLGQSLYSCRYTLSAATIWSNVSPELPSHFQPSYVVHRVQPLPVRHMSHIHARVMVCVLQCLAEGLTSCSTEATSSMLSVARRLRIPATQ